MSQFFLNQSGVVPTIPKGVFSEGVRYESYSGTDIVAEIILPGCRMVLGELQTISYSVHRENTPVRLVGHTNVSGFVRGPRTIAGSMIFTNFNVYAFYRLAQLSKVVDQISNSIFPLADMLPPFDVVLTFANETGITSRMAILGMTIVDEGGTMSVDDLMTETTLTYMARGIEPLVPATFNQLSPVAPPPSPNNNITFVGQL